MVTPVLRELAGPYPPLPFNEPWFLSEDIVQHLTNAWEQICHRITQTGATEELHATRDDYQTTLLGYLKILDGYVTMMSRFQGESPHGGMDRIALNRDQLQKHYDSLFPRWQTLDDLEAILLERVSLPNDQLKELAAKYPPPSVWYDETDDQLTTE